MSVNAQTVRLDVGECTEGGKMPVTHLWLEDERGEWPMRTFVPEELVAAADARAAATSAEAVMLRGLGVVMLRCIGAHTKEDGPDACQACPACQPAGGQNRACLIEVIARGMGVVVGR